MPATQTITRLTFTAAQTPIAQATLKELQKRYGLYLPEQAEAIIALGGDGFMLETLHTHMDLVRCGLPVYGMNQGTIGFLMNTYNPDALPERLNKAESAQIHPLKMTAQTEGSQITQFAFNEVALFRQSWQAAHIDISVDNKPRLTGLIADGILLSTPAGSTAYNLSAHGPVIPLGAEILALTPISAFRPRRWRGALLNARADVQFTVQEPLKRPVSATADSQEIRHVQKVFIQQDYDCTVQLLFDPDHALDEKILQEQFS